MSQSVWSPQPQHPPMIPPRRKGVSATVWLLLIVPALCCGIGVAGMAIKAWNRPARDQAPAAAVATPSLSPGEQLAKAITGKLGKPNRDGVPSPTVQSWPDDPGKAIIVKWAINDNLTEGMIRDGARGDVLDIIAAVKAHATWQYAQLKLTATFRMADEFGNASESIVVDLTFSHEKVEKINPDGVRLDRVMHLADYGVVHPQFL